MSEYFLRRQSQRPDTEEFLDYMKTSDADSAFLDQTEQKMKDLVDNIISSGNQERAEQARQVQLMLLDMVALRRSWCDMLKDRWASDGLDLSCFFEGSKKPSTAEQAYGDFEEEDEAPSLLTSPQLPSLGLFGARDAGETAPKSFFGFLT